MTSTATARPRRRWLPRLVLTVLLLAGVTVLLWPVGQTVVHDQTLTRTSEAYASSVATLPPAVRDDVLAAARAYDASLSPTAFRDPWTAGTSAAGDAAHRDYLAQLDRTDAMARLRIPAIDVDLPVVHDATDAALLRGVGHLYGSSLPVGGSGTHAVLAGHTNWPGQTFLDRLPELRLGDTFAVDVYGQTLTYRVDRITVVRADEFDELRPVPGEDHLTLVTCVVRGDDLSQRLLVRGTRVPDAAATPVPGATVTTSTTSTVTTTHVSSVTHVQAWMWPRVAAGAGVLALLLVLVLTWIVSDLRRRKASR